MDVLAIFLVIAIVLFFVYIGILLDFSNPLAIAIGSACALLIMLVRPMSNLITPGLAEPDKALMAAVFARGIAPAVIVQIALSHGIPEAGFLSSVVMVFILGTILFSSVRIFLYKRHFA